MVRAFLWPRVLVVGELLAEALRVAMFTTKMLLGDAFMIRVIISKVFVANNIFNLARMEPEEAHHHEAFVVKDLATGAFTTRRNLMP